ncbi:9897_t:CDS:2 [Funneliformis mosseae]|uniref:9897_t:CDS:1 n=1 Tax=Funneliformis mosseae TaxID=27381 RepID=A0A9N9GBK9_FUNMO|nr:9897_t:CDS:2 [Funneliformis mosseae]
MEWFRKPLLSPARDTKHELFIRNVLIQHLVLPARLDLSNLYGIIPEES